MKLFLDTEKKVIKVEEAVNLGELYDALDKMLPESLWRKFSLEVNTQIVWEKPIIIRDYIPTYPYPYWHYPWYVPTTQPILYDAPATSITYELTSGTYCVQA